MHIARYVCSYLYNLLQRVVARLNDIYFTMDSLVFCAFLDCDMPNCLYLRMLTKYVAM